jgi:hypothetical protein
MPGKRRVVWQPITGSEGEPAGPVGPTAANRWIVDDLIAAIEKDRPPIGSLADGRAALEMILAVYESHRRERAVDLPLSNRAHPLSGW